MPSRRPWHWKLHTRDLCVIRGHVVVIESGVAKCARCRKVIA